MSAATKPVPDFSAASFRQILGIKFFVGNAAEAVKRMNFGGLLVVPAAPALKDLPLNTAYREALLNADLAIADSGFMVLVWNCVQKDRISKISGLAYLRELLQSSDFREPGTAFWIMPSQTSAACNTRWLKSRGTDVTPENVYVAPMYSELISDEILVEKLRACRPRHIIVALGGGTQERLGLYLKQNLAFRPAIHCIGAAIAFLSGDQVRIPAWADQLYLGWLLRCVSAPHRYVSRYWGARMLLPLIIRYRQHLPSRA